MTPLIKASETLGRELKRGDIVIYKSTVYPGATEEDCPDLRNTRVVNVVAELQDYGI